jgi:uncharacterized membrane protein YhaH (DUF805 family)
MVLGMQVIWQGNGNKQIWASHGRHARHGMLHVSCHGCGYLGQVVPDSTVCARRAVEERLRAEYAMISMVQCIGGLPHVQTHLFRWQVEQREEAWSRHLYVFDDWAPLGG